MDKKPNREVIMKKSELRMMIREIVREEVALTVKEVIKEIVGAEPKQKSK